MLNRFLSLGFLSFHSVVLFVLQLEHLFYLSLHSGEEGQREESLQRVMYEQHSMKSFATDVTLNDILGTIPFLTTNSDISRFVLSTSHSVLSGSRRLSTTIIRDLAMCDWSSRSRGWRCS